MDGPLSVEEMAMDSFLSWSVNMILFWNWPWDWVYENLYQGGVILLSTLSMSKLNKKDGSNSGFMLKRSFIG